MHLDAAKCQHAKVDPCVTRPPWCEFFVFLAYVMFVTHLMADLPDWLCLLPQCHFHTWQDADLVT